ncbi:trypsin-like serine protease with C-terminal PDZ domain [Chamaesiphon minutus PCC 6605]|uniref:Trypsin-like serine protease with C-terminal PDZ domain n=2 Tax=Chamaesiphon TaxID=217161 RepID=K9UKE6_CHAP6|nr:trypsin-like serine protease with C-terminal PDZ domain [Chamaesiphon minutus PCC 6605]
MHNERLSGMSIWIRQWLTIGAIVGINIWLAPSASALSASEVGKIAKSVTVSIDSENSVGSGVVISKEGNIYTVLTAAHVVRDRQAQFKLTTPDGKNYPLTPTNIKATTDVDLAIVKFQSSTNYPIAKLGNVETVSEGTIVYVAGFPLATAAISASIYNFTEGKVTANANRPLAGGYSLVYSNNTLPGMSGGPVFNEAGETIAIHGKGDVQESNQASEINENIRIKTGFNLGIPTNTFMRLAGKLGVNFGGKPPIVVAANTPKTPQAVDFFLIGVDRFNRGNLGGSIEAMNEAIKLNPRYTKAYIARATANFMSKRIGAAISDVDLAIQSEPTSGLAYAGKCFFLSEFGKHGEALGACNRAVSLAPKSAMVYNVKGLVGLRLRNYSVAAADLERSIELDPKLYYAYNNLAIVRNAQRNTLAAINLARRAVQIAPKSPATRALLGQLLVANKDYRQGLMELNMALGWNPRMTEAYKARAVANRAIGNTAAAQLDDRLARQYALTSTEGFIDDISFLNQ